MPRFKVLGGKHADPKSGKVYRKGDVIETDKELDKVFANKFKRLGEVTLSPANMDEMPEEAKPYVDPPNVDVLKAKKNAIARRAKTASEEEEQMQMARTRKKFREEVKFDRSVGKNVADTEEPEEDEDEEVEETEEEEEQEEADFGEDVTDKFPEAAEKSLKVFKEGKKHVVVSEEEPGKALNAEELTSKKAVKDFIEEVEMEESEDDEEDSEGSEEEDQE